MENITNSKCLYLAFSNHGEKQPLLSIVFFLIYIIGVLVNLIIIIVIYLDSHLHTPMYFFLCTLAFVDICYPTVTLPKLMDILLSGDNSITLIQCFTQMYFFLALAAVEATLLASMAYDRYVAICKPLQYHLIMNRRFCVLAIVGIWISALVNSAFLTHLASKLANCGSNKIKQFFCEIKGVAYISCDRTTFYGAIYVEAFFYGITTFSLNLLSYINIIRNILHIKSKHGRQRAFSTCTSHFIVLIIFYGSGMWTYLRPPSQSEELDQVFTVLLVGVTPMLNPLIYSLRNKEVQNALLRIECQTYKLPTQLSDANAVGCVFIRQCRVRCKQLHEGAAQCTCVNGPTRMRHSTRIRRLCMPPNFFFNPNIGRWGLAQRGPMRVRPTGILLGVPLGQSDPDYVWQSMFSNINMK
ncbi:hypothetical protein XELAEV_18000249mg, partial [Xenopus laevis]